MGANTHTTAEPAQTKTDEMAVFGDQSAQLDPNEDLVLLGRYDVPRYDSPDESGNELSAGERYAIAVAKAIRDRDDVPPEMLDGEEYMVLYDLEKPMAHAQYDDSLDIPEHA
jgi:hypothetical protein